MSTVINQKKKADLSKLVYKLMREHPDKKMYEIINLAASHPAPRFYVSYENARRYVSELERGKELNLKVKHTIDMYKELHRRYVLLRKERREAGVRRINYTLLEEIIDSPAPSFYASSDGLRWLFYRHKKKNNTL